MVPGICIERFGSTDVDEQWAASTSGFRDSSRQVLLRICERLQRPLIYADAHHAVLIEFYSSGPRIWHTEELEARSYCLIDVS